MICLHSHKKQLTTLTVNKMSLWHLLWIIPAIYTFIVGVVWYLYWRYDVDGYLVLLLLLPYVLIYVYCKNLYQRFLTYTEKSKQNERSVRTIR